MYPRTIRTAAAAAIIAALGLGGCGDGSKSRETAPGSGAAGTTAPEGTGSPSNVPTDPAPTSAQTQPPAVGGGSSELAGWITAEECPSPEAISAFVGFEMPDLEQEIMSGHELSPETRSCAYAAEDSAAGLFMIVMPNMAGQGVEALAELRQQSEGRAGYTITDEPRLGDGGWKEASEPTASLGATCTVGAFREGVLINLGMVHPTAATGAEVCEIAVALALE
ncbi:MAG: hypothetical protein Q4G64_03945 [bacterium]|nr:hypothetical protein [bacterium]